MQERRRDRVCREGLPDRVKHQRLAVAAHRCGLWRGRLLQRQIVGGEGCRVLEVSADRQNASIWTYIGRTST